VPDTCHADCPVGLSLGADRTAPSETSCHRQCDGDTPVGKPCHSSTLCMMAGTAAMLRFWTSAHHGAFLYSRLCLRCAFWPQSAMTGPVDAEVHRGVTASLPLFPTYACASATVCAPASSLQRGSWWCGAGVCS